MDNALKDQFLQAIREARKGSNVVVIPAELATAVGLSSQGAAQLFFDEPTACTVKALVTKLRTLPQDKKDFLIERLNQIVDEAVTPEESK